MATMRAWRTHAYGEPRVALKLDTVDIPEPGDGEVRIRALGIPLNLNDLERIRGGNMMAEPKHPYSPGMEVMGIVDACGNGTEALRGKRVVAITKGAHGGFAEYSICPAGGVFEMPEEIPMPDAAAIFFPFHLAWLGLYDRAELKAGESVLIHAAAGGAGSAAIQLAVRARRAGLRHGRVGRQAGHVPGSGGRVRDQLQDRRLPQDHPRADRRQGRRCGVRQCGRGGDGEILPRHCL